MKIMLDTNVILSILLFPNDRMNKLMEYVSSRHTLVISSVITDEIKEVVLRKFPHSVTAVKALFDKISFEQVNIPEVIDMSLFKIRDDKDYFVLYGAIIGNVDIFITGDKDFKDIKIRQMRILTPKEFMDEYLL